MDKSGYAVVIGMLLLVIALIGGGVWLGGILGTLVCIVGVVGAIIWLIFVFRLIALLGADIP